MGKAVFNPEIKEVLDSFLLDNPKVIPGKMFGYPAYYVNKKLFACLYEEGVGVKVPFELAQELIGMEGITSFVPLGRRVMKEWIQINRINPEEYRDDKEIFKKSFDFVEGLEK